MQGSILAVGVGLLCLAGAASMTVTGAVTADEGIVQAGVALVVLALFIVSASAALAVQYVRQG